MAPLPLPPMTVTVRIVPVQLQLGLLLFAGTLTTTLHHCETTEEVSNYLYTSKCSRSVPP